MGVIDRVKSWLSRPVYVGVADNVECVTGWPLINIDLLELAYGEEDKASYRVATTNQALYHADILYSIELIRFVEREYTDIAEKERDKEFLDVLHAKLLTMARAEFPDDVAPERFYVDSDGAYIRHSDGKRIRFTRSA